MVTSDVDIFVHSYQNELKKGDKKLDLGLEITIKYHDLTLTECIPYENAAFIMEKLPSNDKLKKEMHKALRELPR